MNVQSRFSESFYYFTEFMMRFFHKHHQFRKQRSQTSRTFFSLALSFSNFLFIFIFSKTFVSFCCTRHQKFIQFHQKNKTKKKCNKIYCLRHSVCIRYLFFFFSLMFANPRGIISLGLRDKTFFSAFPQHILWVLSNACIIRGIAAHDASTAS